MPLPDVLKKLAELHINTVELATGNYVGDAHCKLSMLDNPSQPCAGQSRNSAAT